MPNLLDVIPATISSSNARISNPKMKQYAADYATTVTDATKAAEYMNKLGLLDHDKFATKFSESIRALQENCFEETLSLPSSLKGDIRVWSNTRVPLCVEQRGHNNLDGLSTQPISSLKEMRRAADLLGMVIMPYSALDARSLAAENRDVRVAVNSFVEAAHSANLRVYAMAPISLYDVGAHVKAFNAGVIVYGKSHDMILKSIAMQIPMFRSLLKIANDLDNRVSALEGHRKVVDEQLKSLQDQVYQLQKSLNEMRQESFVTKHIPNKKEAAEAETLRLWVAEDPLVFALHPEVNLLADDGSALLGPCWGPDFNPVLLEAVGLKIIKGQRKAICSSSYFTE